MKIRDGVWKAHCALPSERKLASRYDLSRVTVRKALEVLELQGYIYRQHGRGTFVSPARLQQDLAQLASFTEEMETRGMEAGQEILAFEYTEPPELARKELMLPGVSEYVLHIERIRFAGEEPIGIHDAYLSLPSGKKIAREELEARGSLYALLREKLNLIVTEAREVLRATVADHRQAKLLGIHEGSPLFSIRRTTWSQDRSPLEYVRLDYRGDRYVYLNRPRKRLT
jgi:GntR family transcriptional regulator